MTSAKGNRTVTILTVVKSNTLYIVNNGTKIKGLGSQ
jgi:hypothetical protein